MSNSRSTQPRKQRRANFQASSFDRHRQLSVSLSRDLRSRYHRRALPLRKGDTVRVISGSFKGREERVTKVDMESQFVTLDNVTIKKVDQKLKPLPIRSTHLILTRLNLADPWRRKILNVTAAEVPPEEAAPAAVPEPATEPAATEPASEENPETAEAPVTEKEPEKEPETEAVPVPSKKRRAKSATPAEDNE